MQYFFRGIIAILLLSTTCTIHLTSVDDQQYEALVSQQLKFKSKINSINLNIDKVKKDVNATDNLNEQIAILENAITTERSAVYDASFIMINDQTTVSDSCQTLTE